ncbi:dihydrofolate reductase-thymidylate synthase [Perkinsela sp. CCAP 1560/4]|nr:dihydrofolate reductase-thymidylate synthase [Perkinsela sp. CCAP 1560/4]|eukprot:KNH05762.1 dihydrofolate reductase-thymidylate synthase [Perkinsela sp. CCAP 1560/4]
MNNSRIEMPPAPPLSAGLRAINVIVAADRLGGIGVDNTLPWHLPSDMKYFKETTTKVPAVKEGEPKVNAVIMGRKTFESIPQKFRPLAGRFNIIISSAAKSVESAVIPDLETPLWVSSLEGAIKACTAPEVIRRIHKVFVIGGASLYSACLSPSSPVFPYVHSVFMTRVDGLCVKCDIVVPQLAADHSLWTEKGVFYLDASKTAPGEAQTDGSVPSLTFQQWNRKNPEEHQYLDLIRRIITTGNLKADRTNVGVKSLFGAQMRYDLSNGRIPLLTTKRVFWRGVVEELFWFIQGDTDANHLRDKDVRIWDGNGSREYLDSLGLTDRREGDLGPVYGFQWRHFGASYTNCDDDYTGKGVDQLRKIVDALRNNPSDRRMLLCAWNPVAIPEMALPPCHVLSQFYVAGGKLSCQLYQRSADMGLGVPFNIASYALLTILLAKCAGLDCGELVHTLGDAHVYTNHIGPLEQQLLREPRSFPFLHFNRHPAHLEEYRIEDLELVDYLPYPTIKMDMAV